MKLYEIAFDENDEEQGLMAVSFVDQPAVEVQWLKFANEKLFFTDDEKRVVTGVSLLADTPI